VIGNGRLFPAFASLLRCRHHKRTDQHRQNRRRRAGQLRCGTARRVDRRPERRYRQHARRGIEGSRAIRSSRSAAGAIPGRCRAPGLPSQRRFSDGLSYQISWVFAHSNDYSSRFHSGATNRTYIMMPQDDNDRNAEYAASDFDVRHRLVASQLYELPFGSTRRWVNSGPLAAVIGGWSVASIWTFQTGHDLRRQRSVPARRQLDAELPAGPEGRSECRGEDAAGMVRHQGVSEDRTITSKSRLYPIGAQQPGRSWTRSRSFPNNSLSMECRAVQLRQRPANLLRRASHASFDYVVRQRLRRLDLIPPGIML
jgi:hypothetical protein